MTYVQPYPLFDNLYKHVSEREDKSVDIDSVSTIINDISLHVNTESAREHYDEICALILHYFIVYNPNCLPTATPYDSKTMVTGKGVLYYLTNLPPLLQQIIAQYIEDEIKL